MKRGLDVLMSAVLLLLLSPVIGVTALIIRYSMGTPVLFRQQRPGFGRRPFQLLKFRTMEAAPSDEDASVTDAARLTRLGTVLRRASLDELPTLLNVLRGEMSLVGPRPLLVRYLPYFSERERLRFTVPPGITGWAQINGRNSTPWSVRLEQDAWYVENATFWLDIRILAATPLRILRGRDVVEDARSVMPNLDEERSGRVDSMDDGR